MSNNNLTMKIIGHQKQWNFLVKAAKLKRLPHALLFSGQKQLGKRTIAFEFAKFLNCLSPQTDFLTRDTPYRVCKNCRDINNGVFPDLILVEPEMLTNPVTKKVEQSNEIKILQIKKLVENLSLRPYSSLFKIAIINDAHLMNEEAQNSFLKFLEEPRGESILILITEHPNILLPTIVSRVQQIKFFPVESQEIKNYLLQKNVSEKEANEISFLSLGRPGKAIDLYLNPKKLENEKKMILSLVKIRQSELSFRFQYAKKIAEYPKEKLKEILNIWLIYFRSLLVSCLKNKKEGCSLRKIIKNIKDIQEAESMVLFSNVNLKLLIENLLIEM